MKVRRDGLFNRPTEHFITTGVPFGALPATKYFKFAPRTDADVLASASGDPLVGVSAYGRGRVVAFTYGTMGRWAISGGLTPHVRHDSVPFHYWEYYHSLLIKSLLWAANREPEILIERIEPSKRRV
ncbi:MAG: hypothetical protein QF577_10125, partial [Phycisphaerae bacterium]|nr:hypothetical protein [Phycisphaerae bacterium]